jgi:hypothetical protein
VRPEGAYYKSYNAPAFNGNFNATPVPIPPNKYCMWLFAADMKCRRGSNVTAESPSRERFTINHEAFVGFDVQKETFAIAIAKGEQAATSVVSEQSKTASKQWHCWQEGWRERTASCRSVGAARRRSAARAPSHRATPRAFIGFRLDRDGSVLRFSRPLVTPDFRDPASGALARKHPNHDASGWRAPRYRWGRSAVIDIVARAGEWRQFRTSRFGTQR